MAEAANKLIVYIHRMWIIYLLYYLGNVSMQ